MQATAYVNLIESAADQGVDPAMVTPMGELLERAVAEGHGDEDLAVTVRLLRKVS